MKGTIAILGCLFAAYAAPLFANEVPLILEETIQLPVETTEWDVAPSWDGTYTWMTMAMEGTSIRTHWSQTVDSSTHTFQTIRSIAEEQSISQARLVLQGNEYYAWFHHHQNPDEWNDFGDTETALTLRLATRYPDVLCSWHDRIEGESEEDWYEFNDYQVRLLDPRFMPPDNSVDLPMQFDYSVWSFMWGSGHGYYCVPSSQANCDSFRFRQNSTYSCSYWADTLLIGTLSEWQYADRWWFGYSIFSNEGVRSRSVDSVAIQNEEYYHDYAVAFDVGTNTGVGALVTVEGNLKLHYEGENAFRHAHDGVYSTVKSVYLLPTEASEQLLAVDSSGICDIYRLDDGQIWGQTSPLHPGFAEMKIIGRYHNETRRLVVRYGSELRIYRFGDPILDADDTRPELPSELILSAYPNPFNPTTMIAFDLPKAGRAKLVVYDLNGRLVQTLLDEQMSGGHHELGFDGAALPSGIYFARLVAGDLTRTHKLVLMK